MATASRSRLLVRRLGVLIGIVGLALLTSESKSIASVDQGIFITVPSQPINVGDAMAAALVYHDSGAYEKGLEAVAAQAQDWLRTRAPGVKRPALVLDIDETSLSNREVLKRDNFWSSHSGAVRSGD